MADEFAITRCPVQEIKHPSRESMMDLGPLRYSYPQNVLALAERDPQLHALLPMKDEPTALLLRPSLQQLMEAVMVAYADRPALGSRSYAVKPDPVTGVGVRVLLPEFRMCSYRELNSRVKRLAAAWRLHPRHRVDPGDFVCIFGFTGVNHVVLDYACAYAQAVSVPLQANPTGDLRAVLANTAPTSVAAPPEDLVAVAEMAVAYPSIRSIVAFDLDLAVEHDRIQLTTARDVLAAGGSRAELILMTELLDYCADQSWRPLPPSTEGEERIALLLHSSGSTGEPKGAILTERLASKIFMMKFAKVPVIVVACAPWNHRAGQFAVSGTLARGGTVYFTARPDLSELFADIRLVRPTELMMFPRVMEVIHGHFKAEVARRSGGAPSREIDAQVMTEMRTGFLGDRVCAMVYGSAPITPELKRFITDCFRVPLTDRYGSTELGSIMVNGRVARPPVIAYKLRDAPELGYTSSDTGVPGYFRQPEASARLFDEEGYYRTGDILEERAPDELVFIDRINDVVKLSQGEFVSVGALGATLEEVCPAIQQMYLYGSSTRPYLVAVVVPNMEVVRERLGASPNEAAVRALLREEMQVAGATRSLRPFEIPRDFLIEQEPFSFENGLLTSVRKRRRPALRARYGEQLEALYTAQDRRRADELGALGAGSGLSVQDRVIKALEASLGVGGDLDVTQSFAGLGGDSLGATSFAMLLEEMFGVEVPVNTILSPAGSVRSWSRAIEAASKRGAGALPTYDRIHGDDRSRLVARDLDIYAFLKEDTIDHAPLEPPLEPAHCVLLTGATGYLGRFLCLEWLKTLEVRDGRLICLVRGTDPRSALRRLTESFATDDSLARRFEKLARGRLEIVIGDVAEPRLGLDDATWNRLAHDVDRIVHCGALVNHVLPYPELFHPNVLGTAQLLELALTYRQKSFDFISSVAVANLLEPNAARREESPLLDEVMLNSAYAEGYACSKWAGEHLLHSASARFGLPITVYRCGMVLADRRYAGQLNVPDTLTRLLYSLVMTQSAPESFYKRRADGAGRPGHYAGLPVDFAAAAIVGIGDTSLGGPAIRTLHVINHNMDAGVSLDTFVDWIEQEGYPIWRESDYDRWLSQFQARLRALPEDQRQLSVLPVLASVRAPIEATSSISSNAFVEAVSLLPMRRVPPLDRALLQKYLHDLQLLGLIPEPGLVIPGKCD